MDVEKILHKYLVQALKSATKEVAKYARNHHEYKARTGMLERATIYKVSENDLKGWVTIDRTIAPYGPYVHRGYKAFDIVPRNKKALRWVASTTATTFNGKAITKRGFAFAKRVHHPGYKGDPFLFNALEAKQDDVIKIFNSRVEAALQEIIKGL